MPFALAHTLLDEGGALTELGRADEAAVSLREARSLLTQLRAEPWSARKATQAASSSGGESLADWFNT